MEQLQQTRGVKLHTPAVLPYQGSKRRIAAELVSVLTSAPRLVVEPFAGSAAVSLTLAACYGRAQLRLSDAWAPVPLFWNAVLESRESLCEAYEALWLDGQRAPRSHYDAVRSQFNIMPTAAALLYLMSRCVKNAVRLNAHGEFNQSPDLRRSGATPQRVSARVEQAHRLLIGRTTVSCVDFRDAVESASSRDLVYLDPPYQGTSAGKDRRYAKGLDREGLTATIDLLRRRNVNTIVSLDGRTGDKSYADPLPVGLGLRAYEIDAGRSSQATLLGRNDRTFERVYLSPRLQAPGHWREVSPGER